MKRRKARQPRSCSLCGDDTRWLDYKDVERLQPFLDDGGRIRSRRRTHTCAKHQRLITRAVKRARHVALLPFASAHVRVFS